MSASPTHDGVSIAWFRIGDLRITDHEPLHEAISSIATKNIIPFFCLDHRLLQPLPDSLLHLPATGPYRLAAILEAVHSLQISLQDLGSDLITSTGNTAESLNHLVTTATADSSSRPPSHITLHYYPCLLDFDGTLGKKFENEVTETFLKAAAAQKIPAQVRPSTLGNGGGTSVLYLPEEIAAIHSTTAGTAGHLNETLHSEEYSGVHAVVQLLESKPSMTEFRKIIQTTTHIRPALPAPVVPLPPMLTGIRTHLYSKNWGFKPLEPIPQDSLDWREYYIAAGAEEALKNLEKLALGGGGGGDSGGGGGYIQPSSFAPALADEKQIGDRVVRIQRPPIGEKEVQARLDRLFIGETSSGLGAITADGKLPFPISVSVPLMNSYRESRMTASNGLQTSAMLSLALSLGTLSIRSLYETTVQAMLDDHEPGGRSSSSIDNWQWSEPTIKSPGHHWLLMHLGIRDFFSYYAVKCALEHPFSTSCSSNLRNFPASGPRDRKDLAWSTNQDFLSSWAQGQTGFPFVDASMRELIHTGWCSNRGRQNVASFLSKFLHIDWRRGEEFFSSVLIDHNFAINWASWAYVAGVGADPRDRVFKTVTQGEKYDPEGEFIAEWVPELAESSGQCRHRPWERKSENDSHERKNRPSYPAPIMNPRFQIGKGK
jgi:deoxyribodipyrimidine photolyase